MSNTKAIGVAYSDPAFDSLTVSGNTTLAAVSTGAITATSVVTTGTTAATTPLYNAQPWWLFNTANSTTTTASAGSLATTSNATGLGKLFISDGTKWQYPVVA